MKVAIIGSGIAGNVAAYHLCREHEITVFEANAHVGGHTHTHAIDFEGRSVSVDTGFIVFNDWTYPNFIALLNELGVESQQSEMSFSVKCAATGLEYNGTTLNSLFAQRSNLLRPSFFRMIRDILRFNREAPALLEPDADNIGLGHYLRQQRYSPEFVRDYLLPMGSAIWSASAESMHAFPAKFFVRFFHNHGMLSIDRRPTWKVVRGGSARYVDRLIAPFRDRVRVNSPIETVRRLPTHVVVKPRWGESERFDQVIFACHSDQALRLLTDATPLEREILGAIPYQANDVVLHTDVSVLPQRKLAWAAWNYHLLEHDVGRAAVTYHMNILQRLQTKAPLLVTLNMTEVIDPAKILHRFSYEHPQFTPQGVAAQARHAEIDGVHRTDFCGAYWRNGFHEDGVVSALRMLDHFKEHTHAQRHLHRIA